jgi:hypothetical protein
VQTPSIPIELEAIANLVGEYGYLNLDREIMLFLN